MVVRVPLESIHLPINMESEPIGGYAIIATPMMVENILNSKDKNNFYRIKGYLKEENFDVYIAGEAFEKFNESKKIIPVTKRIYSQVDVLAVGTVYRAENFIARFRNLPRLFEFNVTNNPYEDPKIKDRDVRERFLLTPRAGNSFSPIELTVMDRISALREHKRLEETA